MMFRLKLWQKIFIVTAMLGLPLIIITREYVIQIREQSLNNLKEQSSALPALRHIGELTKLVQDHGASLPLWVIGSDISPNQNRESGVRIDAMLAIVRSDLEKLAGFNPVAWDELSARVKSLHTEGSESPRGFSAYGEISSALINYAEMISYDFKYYSGVGNLIIPSRMAVDLTLSLAENLNLLRGYVTFKVFINEKTLSDVSTTASYLSLADYRYREIQQSLVDLKEHNPELYDALRPELSKIDTEMRVVRSMVEQYDSDAPLTLDPAFFFERSTQLITSVYSIHGICLDFIEEQLASQIAARQLRLEIIIGIAILCTLLVLAFVIIISRSLVKGVREIEFLAEQVAGGNRTLVFPAQTQGDEIDSIIGEIRKIYLSICSSEAASAELLQTTQMQSEELQDANAEMEEKSLLLHEQQITLQEVNVELEERRGELEAQNEKLESVIENLAVAKRDAEEKGREAEIANRYKSIFLANMSHELRTPLNSILILAQVLSDNRDKSMSEAQIKNASIIFRSGQDLLKLINEILDLSRIEAGKIEINPVELSLREIADDTELMYKALAANKNLQYAVTFLESCPPFIKTDGVRFAQIIRNLVANAIKFTEEGSVEVTFAKSRDPLYHLEIAVKDSGIGIDEDQQALIFEPFKQLNNSLSRSQDGTGLGLSISKNLAAKLGGFIRVESRKGKGSIFTLFLPEATTIASQERHVQEGSAVQDVLAISPQLKPALSRPKEKPAAPLMQSLPPRNTSTFEGRRILAVDDDTRNTFALKQILDGRGCEIKIANSGKEALDLLKADPAIDLVLMDIMMPDMDGFEVMRRIRADADLRSMPIIALTAKAMESDREECLAAGASDYLIKPVDTEKLLMLMAVWLSS